MKKLALFAIFFSVICFGSCKNSSQNSDHPVENENSNGGPASSDDQDNKASDQDSKASDQEHVESSQDSTQKDATEK
ncbi:MAG: hypothetical protein LBC54_01340 [Bacteroidales bacterium OttesenSCG-928-I14]|jgi:hypothetical protein|nr:hypothetical protein [Bacteroidales bacterium OttesenSCG-928-I14]